jgi:hypothetical protein
MIGAYRRGALKENGTIWQYNEESRYEFLRLTNLTFAEILDHGEALNSIAPNIPDSDRAFSTPSSCKMG